MKLDPPTVSIQVCRDIPRERDFPQRLQRLEKRVVVVSAEGHADAGRDETGNGNNDDGEGDRGDSGNGDDDGDHRRDDDNGGEVAMAARRRVPAMATATLATPLAAPAVSPNHIRRRTSVNSRGPNSRMPPATSRRRRGDCTGKSSSAALSWPPRRRGSALGASARDRRRGAVS